MNKMNLGDKITSLRKQKDISQTDLAKMAEVSREIIGRYEHNEVIPSVEVAKKIADALDVSLDFLVGEGVISKFDKKTVKRLEDIENLPTDEKSFIYKVIDMALTYNKTKLAYAHK